MTTVETVTHRVTFARGKAPDLARMLSNALLFASKDAVLPVLCAVRFEFDEKALRVIATDRYRLSVETIELGKPGDETPEIEPFDFLLPATAVKSVIGLLKANKLDPIVLNFDPAAGVLRVETLTTSAEYRTDQDHTFPAYRSLMVDPDKRVATEEIGFTPKYLADLGKVQTSRGKVDMVRVGLYGSGKVTRIDYADGPTVLLMSIRIDSPDGATSQWGSA